MTDQWSFPNASELLKHLAENNDLAIEAPVNVKKIAEAMGVSVDTDPSLEAKDIIGEITFKEGRPVVRINPVQNSYLPRMRFTLAHELGHLCLHSANTHDGFVDSQKTMSRSESYWNRHESEANNFAAQLLMPKPLIVKEGKKVISEYEDENGAGGIPSSSFISRMAAIFKVSNKSMEYRLKNLGVL